MKSDRADPAPAGRSTASALALLPASRRGRQQVADYEANNTYQYIIGREEVQLQWIRDAVVDLGGTVPTDVKPSAVPQAGKGADAERVIYEDDARQMKAFVERWRPRLASLTNARHRKMLELILGEILEQTRLFEQESAGPRRRARAPDARCEHRRRSAARPLDGVVARVAIALGSNLGNRRAQLESAIDLVLPHLRSALVSSVIETDAVGVGDQPRFLNGAMVGEAGLPAPALLARLLAIEEQLGRTRPYWGAPRTIDLDLILYGDVVIAGARHAGAASALPRAPLRARAARRDCPRPRRSGERPHRRWRCGRALDSK